MVKLGLIGGAVFSLTVVTLTPAGANDVQTANGHQSKRHLRVPPHSAIAYGDPNLPVENALRWGYSQGYSNYPSGWGGLYGDGRYPGNVISNTNPLIAARRAAGRRRLAATCPLRQNSPGEGRSCLIQSRQVINISRPPGRRTGS